MFACISLAAMLNFYVMLRLGIRLKRRQPRDEYCFARSFLLWAGVILVGYPASVAVWLWPGEIPAHLFYSDPRLHPLYLIWHEVGRRFVESPGQSLGALILVAVIGGLGLALYERVRCVDASAIPVAE